mmetsp:Transcript_8083/g.12363  ORF Transcript_8083/g.12363 Transcript_8083/m.12363 type:complete len:177 (-) Transcript_8083:248-778(-)|eukprot:CAMPEP_0178906022 /NCGR_PEP_ID=MMETSP0786-20121207/6603_1 /TAXON_ID=186022 /ORGANISM="Thalassionema frauenfeldii, Strain CCMP 1798" /LENGTH=176 /DNA_ID=CAMNT_0020577701 /DNA_START=65 /DNA_END=595 /DNA_ORIENTATION=-
MAKAGLTIIFLDIDGVLLPFGGERSTSEISCSGLFPDRTIEAFNAILKECPSSLIVLSSTWRVSQEFCQQILQAFRDYAKTNDGEFLPTQFYDVTNINNHSERQWEIHDWLSSSQNIEAWIALDDEELIEGDTNKKYCSEFQDHVVKTASHVGLTKKDAETAILLLKAQHKKQVQE